MKGKPRADTSSGRITWITRWKKRIERKERESFYVSTILIGPHPNFKQVRNSDPGRGAHRDVDRRIKWRTFAILESRYFLLSLYSSQQYTVKSVPNMYQTTLFVHSLSERFLESYISLCDI